MLPHAASNSVKRWTGVFFNALISNITLQILLSYYQMLLIAEAGRISVLIYQRNS